jgi:hypothetical protein
LLAVDVAGVVFPLVLVLLPDDPLVLVGAGVGVGVANVGDCGEP